MNGQIREIREREATINGAPTGLLAAVDALRLGLEAPPARAEQPAARVAALEGEP